MTAIGWHYLIHLTNGDVVKCLGDQVTAEKHLNELRAQHVETHTQRFGRRPDTVPYLIGVYPPWSLGGHDGIGGVYSYGFQPTLIGSHDTQPEEWIPA